MEEDHKDSALQAEPPSLVSLTPSFSPSPRRLSSCFSEPRSPIKAARQLAWVSLQGRLINAEEASSAKTIGGLGFKEAVAWELFSPIHRILIVAVVAVAASNSKKNKQILQLNKSVQLRDQVLSSMQQKLDNLCEQLSYFKEQPEAIATTDSSTCQLCWHHKHQPNDWMDNTTLKMSNGHQVFSMPPVNEATEAEERRMSDLSDWAPSVTSSLDIQLYTSATEQDICNLRRECEEKDATIKELATFLHSSEALGSRRIAELEDIIRRKNMIITKLKKDILILEQKVVNLSRLRRPSISNVRSSEKPLPLMTDNLLYDMESSTSPSSSDTDSSPENTSNAPAVEIADTPVLNCESALQGGHNVRQIKASISSPKEVDSWPLSPLKEVSLNQTPESITTSRPKHTTSASGASRSRRRPLARSKDAIPPRRWV